MTDMERRTAAAKFAADWLGRAVMQAYGFSIKEMIESKCVAELMKLYQALTEKQ